MSFHRSTIALALAVALTAPLTGCGGGEMKTTDSAAAIAATAPPTTAQIVAGRYEGVSKSETGDSVRLTWTSQQNADGSGWLVTSTSPDTVRFTATVSGDSIVFVSQPYTDPAMPKTVGQVMWRVAGQYVGDSIKGVGTVSPVSNQDTVLARLRTEGVRKP